MNLDPRYREAVDWCNDMVEEVERFGTAPIISEPDQWRGWAVQVCSFPDIAKSNPPNPLLFDDWQQWAIRFNQCVLLSG
jgi:hypothetical protein